jgi:hypothetical protein
MFRRPYLPALPILLSWFVLVPAAHGEPIPWSYAGQVTLTGPSFYREDQGVTYYGNLTFTNLSGTGHDSRNVGAFDVQLSPGSYGSYSKDSDFLDVRFRITDLASGQSGVFTFHGFLEGITGHVSEMGPDFEAIGYVNGKYLNSAPPALRLGNNLYSATISPFSVGYNDAWGFTPGEPGSAYHINNDFLNGSSLVNVEVTHVTPEPSTLVLVASGITVLGGRLWCRRQRARRGGNRSSE